MSPILQAALGSVIRHFLTMLSAVLVARGIWTPEDSTTYVAAAALAILGFGWAIYQKYAAHSKILDALALPGGSTLDELNAK